VRTVAGCPHAAECTGIGIVCVVVARDGIGVVCVVVARDGIGVVCVVVARDGIGVVCVVVARDGIGVVCVVVARDGIGIMLLYPVSRALCQYMEKLSDGRTLVRSEAAECRASRQHEHHRQRRVETLLAHLQQQLEHESTRTSLFCSVSINIIYKKCKQLF